jgi:HEAT repeat protein
MKLLLTISVVTVAVALSGCGQPRSQGTPSEAKVFKEVTFPANIPPVAVPIDEAVQQKALNQITLAFGSSDPIIRAQSLEAMSRTRDPSATERAQRALADKEWIVRFAGALAAGDLKLKSLYKPLVAVAFDPNPSVRVAVRYALHQIGDRSLSKDLEALSQNGDSHVRGNVAMVLGLMNEPTAARVLRPMISDSELDVRMQAAEALWRLGDEEGKKILIAGTVSGYVDDQIFSVLGLVGPRDQRVKPYVMAKFANDRDKGQLTELQLVAARALGMLGDDSGYGLAVRTATSPDPRRRSLAALALGDIGRPDAQDTLAKLLDDPSQSVRLSAATALRLIANRR